MKTVGSLFSKLKDKIPLKEKSNVVYKIDCINCEKNYIGQTKRTLKSRITSHKSDIRVKPDACALSQHVNQTGHSMDFQNAKVLTTEKKFFKEMFFRDVLHKPGK